METNKILSADLLDIIFEGRNKEYGAYELRKTYNRRLTTALGIMAGIALFIFLISFVVKSINLNDNTKKLEVKDLNLSAVKEPPPPPPPPPPKLPPPPPIATIQFTPPKIVKDEEVVKPPEENKELEEKKVDVVTVEGKKDEGIVAPPVETGTAVVEAPAAKEDEDKVFTKVEIEASFPGGEGAWTRYVTKAIQGNIDELQDAGESGTCRVRFIVSKDGTVSSVEALTLKGSKLAEVAVNAIRKGPKWTPAQQNGRFVNAFREQPVTFQIQEQ